MTPRQCRAARALLSWSQFDLDRRSGITKGRIAKFECLARNLTTEHRLAIKRTFTAAGIEFLDEATHGVRLHGYR